MRAFLCTAPSANYAAIPNSTIWIDNLSNGLNALGVELVLPSFDTHRHMMECMGDVESIDSSTARSYYSELLVQDVKRSHKKMGLDLLVAYVWSAHVLPEAIQQIRSLGIPTVLFYCNAAHQFHLVEDRLRNLGYLQ
jgi:hypothetical protein